MSNLFIRLYLDEDVNVLVADLLKARGFDAVTARDASVHDSQQFCEVLDGENEGDEIWADSAYRNQALEEVLEIVGYIFVKFCHSIFIAA